MSGWIAVDLDGTLAHYDGWVSAVHIGVPIPAMVARIKLWLADGKDVRIFTARVHCPIDPGGEPSRVQIAELEVIRKVIEDWCLEHIGAILPITNVKDYGMIELWDDRAVRVVLNTGNPCCSHKRGI